MTHILIFYNDFQKYPPIISVIETLLTSGDSVIILGYCSNKDTISSLKVLGLEYYEFIIDKSHVSSIIKLMKLYMYRKKVFKFIRKRYVNDKTKIWVFNEQSAWLLHTLFYKYKIVLYLFEFPNLKVSLRFKLLSPSVNYDFIMRNSYKIICCEYNRAMITQSYFQLKDTPIIIPNKPVINKNDIPLLSNIDLDLYNLCINYKIILYQGVFNMPERRLDELCEAIDKLPDEFRLLLMGPEDRNKKRLQETYTSPKIIFVPFLKTPLHLSVTKLCYIGFLSYFASQSNIENSLNTLYCAPNKIYEYALCNIPSLSNNSPALKTIFEKYKIGKVLEVFNTESIVNQILEIDKNYDKYVDYESFLGSVDIEKSIKSI